VTQASILNRKKQIVEVLLEWHQENRRSFPWRDESDPYKVLVAEFFLQRTPAERVAKVYSEFIKEYPNPEALTRADLGELKEKYRSLGLKKRMIWLMEAMKVVCELYGGRIPDSKENLKRLPGVGEYTSSAVLCFAFGRSSEIIDANVERVYKRIFGLYNSVPNKEIRMKARSMVPNNSCAKSYNEALLDFSAIICRHKPNCRKCPIHTMCDYMMLI